MAQLTFRDFAGAVMGGDTARAAEVLGTLLGLDGEAATAAATHFQTRMTADPAFVQKAMGLRRPRSVWAIGDPGTATVVVRLLSRITRDDVGFLLFSPYSTA